MIWKLTEIEIEAFQKLKFNPELEPLFDPMRDCLRWQDEEPKAVSREIYEKFLDLLIARSYIHERRSRQDWYYIEPTSHFADFWDYAKKVIPNWPGFKRLELSKAERKYFEQEKNRDPKEHFEISH